MVVISHNKKDIFEIGEDVPTAFEVEIHSLLNSLGSPKRVAEDILRRWDMNLLSEEEQLDCAQFLLAAGLYPLLFQRIKKLLDNRAQIPWAQLAEAIGRAKLLPTLKETNAILEGAQAQNSEEHLLRSYQLDIWDRTYPERRNLLQSKKTEAIDEQKKSLIEKMQFMRDNQIFEKENEVLEELQNLFPEETNFVREREAYEVRMARELIAKVRTQIHEPNHTEWPREELTQEQAKAKELIVEKALAAAKTNPSSATDLAICLHFMDFNQEAVEVLNQVPNSRAIDWLRLELMILSRQYVNALGESNRLESVYSDDPEAAFAAVYARARALWGLQQSELAIDLMSSLVRVRPNYKSAQSLLLKWTGGES